MRASLIATVYNEEKAIVFFLESVLSQVILPDEVILVDGGSTDKTHAKINEFIKKHGRKLPIRLFVKRGNRAVGRNEAVRKAKYEIILCSDAGCILDKNWVKELKEKFKSNQYEVVAGYYDAYATSFFQKILVPYVLVMPDNVDPQTFLPATRSMAFTKNIWRKNGGFEERYSHNEDYIFARKLKEKGIIIAFVKSAIVHWIPRETFKEAFIMFFRFALGDTEAGIYRGKVQLLFLRYFLFFYLIILSILFKSMNLVICLIFAVFMYLVWSILKNYNYVPSVKSLFYFPAIQLVADTAVLTGSIVGIFYSIRNNLPLLTKKYWVLGVPLIIYLLIMLSLISWGLPNSNHPFTYHMDEWHQIQSVRMTIKEGNPNVPGAAFGPLFQFLLSGLYLIPFTLIGYINPFVIRNSFEQFEMQARLFEVLRFNTVLFGLLSSAGIAVAAIKYLKISALFPLTLFIFTPIFLSISNYFKYDVALLGWETLGIIGILSFVKKPELNRYLLSGFLFGLALATKISALPLIPLYVISYFLFTKKREWKLSTPLLGTAVFLLTFLLFGIPNIFFGKGDYSEFLYSNLVESPLDTNNFILGMPFELYMLIYQFPLLFGIGLAILSIGGILYWLSKFFWNLLITHSISFRIEMFLITGIILFSCSLYVLGIGGTGNRALVLLPFLVLIASLFLKEISKKLQTNRNLLILPILAISIQIFQCIPWLTMKWEKDPREASSEWIQQSIKPRSQIGIELIPIYQYIPDITLKEYYQTQQKEKTRYTYTVIDQTTAVLPDIVIVSNADIAETHLRSSLKKNLLTRLKKEQFKEIARFYPEGFLTSYIPRREFYIANLGPTAPIPVISIFQKSVK